MIEQQFKFGETRVGRLVTIDRVGGALVVRFAGNDGGCYVVAGHPPLPARVAENQPGYILFTPGGPRGGYWRFHPFHHVACILTIRCLGCGAFSESSGETRMAAELHAAGCPTMRSTATWTCDPACCLRREGA